MFIAIVDFTVAPQARPQALQILEREIPLARALPGNLYYRAFTNAGDEAHIGLLHGWESLEHFKAYGVSEPFASIGRQLRPMMTTPPVSQRLSAELLENLVG
ncbi:antibiotic biosynthesis monooxygenase [Devosia sp.]|uniref:putative quinol monooxygenase n=1 Tax=Devosia sp. TaxID=1871048 RepID=UPI003267AA32